MAIRSTNFLRGVVHQLRPYQADLKAAVQAQWAAGNRNVLMRLDTGGGKTVILSALVLEHPGASCVIAHRAELVSQLSLALARNGVRHNLIAAKDDCRAIAALHVAELGVSYYDPTARCAVASVDTLTRKKGLESWAAQVTLWIVDEGHHVVLDNKWHTATKLFTHPACVGLLPTATPKRADGKGLGRPADGVADVMVEGPPMAWLIEQGYLTDYQIFCPESDMRLLEEDIGASGDWSPAKLREAAMASHIVGDVVASYLQFAPGQLGVTFCPDTQTAAEIHAAYEAAGVRAALLTGKTDGGLRRAYLRRFAAREILQLVVVDIVSEGFDLPAIEVGSFARKTASLATYMQQFGRTLRPLPGKGRAKIIDHVGNFLRHGPPDRPRVWSLDRQAKRQGSAGEIPLRVCLECYQPYERFLKVCPYCEAPAPPPALRSAPEHVAGVLGELDPEVLAALRRGVEEIDQTSEEYGAYLAASGCPPAGIGSNMAAHKVRQEAQAHLRDVMGQWGGQGHAAGMGDDELQSRFFYTFGVDVLSAMGLKTREALDLAERIRGKLGT